MWLPVELSLDLQQAGVPIEASDGGLAWSAVAARAVIGALRDSKVAIVSGEVFLSETVGLVPMYKGWTVERHVGETASEYAARSRHVALAQIDAESTSGTGQEFYALRFSSQQDAA